MITNMKDSDFTYEQRNGYYGDVNAICHISKGFNWNEHNICINPIKHKTVDNRTLFVQVSTAHKDGFWYSYYSLQVKVGTWMGSTGGVSCTKTDQSFENKEDAYDHGLRLAIKRLEDHLVHHEDQKDLFREVHKLKGSIDQLSLF